MTSGSLTRKAWTGQSLDARSRRSIWKDIAMSLWLAPKVRAVRVEADIVFLDIAADA